MNDLMMELAATVVVAFAVFALLMRRIRQQQESPEGRAKLRDKLTGIVEGAARGETDPMIQLGLFYSSGRGLAQSDREAYFWLSLAVRKGDGEPMHVKVAMDYMMRSAQKLSDADRAELDQRAAGWTPGPHAADSVELLS